MLNLSSCCVVFESHSQARYEVSPLVVVGAGCGSLHRRPHAVLVVLADEDAGQLPQGGHVERLKQLALFGREDRRRTEEGFNISSQYQQNN